MDMLHKVGNDLGTENHSVSCGFHSKDSYVSNPMQ